MKKISWFMLILTLIFAGCAVQKTLPPEQNPAVIGGYTVPLRFNWFTDSNINKDNRKIKVLMAVANQNPNSQIVIFYGKECRNLASRINYIFESSNYKTVLVQNNDNLKVDITYIYVKFTRPIDESGVQLKSVSQDEAKAVAISNNVY